MNYIQILIEIIIAGITLYLMNRIYLKTEYRTNDYLLLVHQESDDVTTKYDEVIERYQEIKNLEQTILNKISITQANIEHLEGVLLKETTVFHEISKEHFHEHELLIESNENLGDTLSDTIRAIADTKLQLTYLKQEFAEEQLRLQQARIKDLAPTDLANRITHIHTLNAPFMTQQEHAQNPSI